jgi:hypothetical protein
MDIETHDMIGCTMVVLNLKMGYEYVQNVEAGILHIRYWIEMQTVRWTKHVRCFKKLEARR